MSLLCTNSFATSLCCSLGFTFKSVTQILTVLAFYVHCSYNLQNKEKNLPGTQISARHSAALCLLPKHAALMRTLSASNQMYAT
jgi:hypothetical protein